MKKAFFRKTKRMVSFILIIALFASSGVLSSCSVERKEPVTLTLNGKDIKNDVKLKEKFVTDTVNNGYSEETALKVWQEIEDAVSGGYSFNKSHSTSYGVLSYKTAWLKCHYPIYWYASLLNSEISDQSKVESLIAECKKKGIKILPPDINISTNKYLLIDNNIICPLSAIITALVFLPYVASTKILFSRAS